MVYVKDLMELDYFQKNRLTLVAGANGLKRIVKRPNIAQLMNFNEWMAGGEFLLVNGVGLHLDETDQLLKLIENAQKGKAACIAFEISETYLPTIPTEAKTLADQLKLPIFTLSWDVPFGEILNTVYDYIIRKQMEESRILELMQNVLFADINEEYILEQAAFYGFHLENPHCVLIGDCISDTQHEDIYPFLQRCLHAEFHSGQKAMIMTHNGHIVAFLPESEPAQLTKILEHVIAQIQTVFPDVRIIFGIGNYYEQLFDYRNSYYEAVSAFHFLQSNLTQDIIFYDNLGLLRLIDDSNQGEKIKNYVYSYLAPLMSSEHTMLIETLNQFQMDNFNISKAAEHLFIHRNTLLQRLDKIYSLLGIDISDYNVRRDIMNVMYLRHFI